MNNYDKCKSISDKVAIITNAVFEAVGEIRNEVAKLVEDGESSQIDIPMNSFRFSDLRFEDIEIAIKGFESIQMSVFADSRFDDKCRELYALRDWKALIGVVNPRCEDTLTFECSSLSVSDFVELYNIGYGILINELQKEYFDKRKELKRAINSVYGLTSVKFDTLFDEEMIIIGYNLGAKNFELRKEYFDKRKELEDSKQRINSLS